MGLEDDRELGCPKGEEPMSLRERLRDLVDRKPWEYSYIPGFTNDFGHKVPSTAWKTRGREAYTAVIPEPEIWGEGAKALGLKGQLSREQFINLVEGKHPDTGMGL